ncbi:hypothetical protein ACIQ4Z_18145 [Peribacillus asahii]|uniref:hypothetical protein n=1 Tax=Peribacillus asahii TaxID=228899 RepID=UPI00382DB8C3
MLLYLPKHFDENEWFIIIILVLSIFLVRLPKRMPTEVFYLIVLFIMAVPSIIDYSIASIPPYDLYQMNDSEKLEVFDILLIGVYIPFGYLCVYFYEWFQPKQMKSVLYILSWALLATCFEFIMVKLHIFTYHGWSLAYSFPTYLFVISLFVSYYEFLLFHYKKKVECKLHHKNT